MYFENAYLLSLNVFIYYRSETNECESNPCLNGATCIDFFSGFLCQCPPGFGGTFCEQGKTFQEKFSLSPRTHIVNTLSVVESLSDFVLLDKRHDSYYKVFDQSKYVECHNKI